MRWLEVHIDTNHHGLETVEAMLSGLEIDGISVEDEEEFQDFLENNQIGRASCRERVSA